MDERRRRLVARLSRLSLEQLVEVGRVVDGILRLAGAENVSQLDTNRLDAEPLVSYQDMSDPHK